MIAYVGTGELLFCFVWCLLVAFPRFVLLCRVVVLSLYPVVAHCFVNNIVVCVL